MSVYRWACRSGPLLRRGDSGKQTIVDADKVLGNVGGNARKITSEGMVVKPSQLSTTMVSERATEGPAYRNGSEMNPGTPAVMPHILLSENELNEQYPKLHAPDEPTGSDLLDDLSDPVFQIGLKIARDIQQQAVELGRLRHAPPATRAAPETTIATATATATSTRGSRTTTTVWTTLVRMSHDR